uniref:Uncharacterized protein n=1 Tax=Cacopsylla melanoneura TaxID=428564 RepID=A0A8D9BDB9_9HEMI
MSYPHYITPVPSLSLSLVYLFVFRAIIPQYLLDLIFCVMKKINAHLLLPQSLGSEPASLRSAVANRWSADHWWSVGSKLLVREAAKVQKIKGSLDITLYRFSRHFTLRFFKKVDCSTFKAS